ncbi:hypothetical protein KIL84_020730 [Mauremys mutica]|uniref:Uncharacterized protein n=1 Tax=Mauremys mutica TaxID=74926 RepID=A0A9D4B0R2_9SAUR|nr:hypothetical protein KIL84_020730 [Mauremys mutica]
MEANPSLLDTVGVGDLVLLDPLSEESLLQNLKERFRHQEIYTYIGNVVISVNPYQPLPIYSPQTVEDYRNSNFFAVKPHILPPLVVTDRSWPPAPYKFLANTNEELKKIFYPWKCKKYRDRLTPQRKALLQDKLCASQLFKGKKTLYAKSLQQSFQGEYLGLQKNPRYRALQTAAEGKLVLADTVRKVNRANGKAVPRLFLLTKNHIILADPKAAQPKTVVSLSDIQSVSVTRFSDGFFVLHLNETSTVGAKGDFLLVSDHLIELVTKLHQTLLETTAKTLNLQVADEFSTQFGKASVAIRIVETAEKNGAVPVCKKRGSHKMEVLVH